MWRALIIIIVSDLNEQTSNYCFLKLHFTRSTVIHAQQSSLYTISWGDKIFNNYKFLWYYIKFSIHRSRILEKFVKYKCCIQYHQNEGYSAVTNVTLVSIRNNNLRRQSLTTCWEIHFCKYMKENISFMSLF